ncbi:patronin isoform X2 [Leptopilina heterotoma]|uniref:patronin isoform X2 n=1 Tax=Leptopilina heterotoma TaxID=63436 RepID=UPI001CA939CD|nr:patronin isoform X2 [Leptopilina heterotoma]
MWSTISRLLGNKGKNENTNLDRVDKKLNEAVDVFDKMERNKGFGESPAGGGDPGHLSESYESRQAKQRASVKWLLSKAYSNNVPIKLREPYYRDHEDQEHLKPQIVQALSNAELYCMALASIYSDPNYNNQNHSGILQALARKGVFVSEPNNTQITETILIQNSPLKMSAHMAVIEGLMILYAKEVVMGEQVVSAIRRFDPLANVEVPVDHEKGLLLWISHASQALIGKIQTEEDGAGDKTRLPELPTAKDFQALCDGVGLAAVVALYCPGELNWMQIRVSKRPSVADALHNLSLVHSFCSRCLPYAIFHMQPEDVTYMRGSMKQNLVVFLADMYNALELNSAECVRYPGKERAHQFVDVPKPLTTMTVKKSQSLQQTAESHSFQDRRGDESFVVHRMKGVPTLSSVADEKSIARAEAAGRPSNWEDQRRTSYGGRRSRRNSVSDDSQLTIENFGGSQDNIHNFGRNPDKEMGVVTMGKRIIAEPTLPARSSVQDVYGSGVQLILSDNGYNNDEQQPFSRLRRHPSNTSLDSVALKNSPSLVQHSSRDNSEKVIDNNEPTMTTLASGVTDSMTKLASFANLNRQSSEKGINFNYMEQEREQEAAAAAIVKSNIANKKHGQTNGNGFAEKKTTFATLPNTTTWQQQSSQQNQQSESHSGDDPSNNTVMASQLNNIRLKLEEKRRHIENEKRRMEIVMSKQRQKVGKAAFLQAVTKGKVKSPASSASGGDSPVDVGPPNQINSCSVGESPINAEASSIHQQITQDKPQRPFSLKEISEDVRDVEHKWLEQDGSAPFVETRRTPDIENMDLEQYHQSISQMNTSLSEIHSDIQRLASQQNQIQQQHLMTQHQQQMQQQLQQLQSFSQQHLQGYSVPSPNSMTARIQDPQQSQFYLHDQPQQLPRRTWGSPLPAQSLANEMAAVSFQSPVDPRFNTQSIVYQQDPRIYQDTRSWGVHHLPQQKGFVLHDATQEQRYLNGGDHSLCNNQISHTASGYPTSSSSSSVFNQTPPPSASPQHRNAVHRISQLMSDTPEIKRPTIHHVPITCESPTEKRQISSVHSSVPAPPVDDMEPQNISFIGNDEDLSQDIRKHITSGSRTYRIPSPMRPSISRNSFQPPSSLRETTPPPQTTLVPEVALNESRDDNAEKGFYISFDNDAPKKPKPTLRQKKASPKKEQRTMSQYSENALDDYSSNFLSSRAESPSVERHLKENFREAEKEKQRLAAEREHMRQEMRDRELKREIDKEQRQRNREATTTGVGLVIGNQLANPDPNSLDEMEKKKEKIMLLSLQRRQQQEELKERKETEAQARREQEKFKEEERARKKDEERQRRAAILEQYKLKKAIEEAEREGKVIDKEILNAIKPTKRNKVATSRPRPKTIHVDAGAELDSGALTPSRGKKGSSSNLSTASLISPTMRRDYYRGSQDSLTAAHLDDRRSGPLYRGGSLRVSSVDSPDDGRGSSPSRSTNQLGRRGSYKTSRDTQEPQQQVRGRPKYPTYQNFKGRKSNSLMNLCDTDSGLGRATPPRRAPSPGMGSMRHLPSPSGPGSLPPGLMTKRRVFDDGSSDISSTPSSMMDYNGPRLYKQPATKSNRNIMLNAVEYCVFPGTVNRDAKRRVLDEIARSESKHFLILFRDAGCQFRALYSYCPDRDDITKLYGTGPKQVIDKMFDRFFKYNSGGKCFSQVHTKHLTVTIDAFTIHNSLWQGKKVNLPNKKDMALVI